MSIKLCNCLTRIGVLSVEIVELHGGALIPRKTFLARSAVAAASV